MIRDLLRFLFWPCERPIVEPPEDERARRNAEGRPDAAATIEEAKRRAGL